MRDNSLETSLNRTILFEDTLKYRVWEEIGVSCGETYHAELIFQNIVRGTRKSAQDTTSCIEAQSPSEYIEIHEYSLSLSLSLSLFTALCCRKEHRERERRHDYSRKLQRFVIEQCFRRQECIVRIGYFESCMS
jgi:hypothetical protein